MMSGEATSFFLRFSTQDNAVCIKVTRFLGNNSVPMFFAVVEDDIY